MKAFYPARCQPVRRRKDRAGVIVALLLTLAGVLPGDVEPFY